MSCKKCILIVVLFFSSVLKAQTTDNLPYTINMAGTFGIINGQMYDGNFGELVLTETFSGLPNMLLTQGFLQPFFINADINTTPLVFYNAFSPNGDGKNDTWVIKDVDKYPINTLVIFNRFGGEVYKASNYSSTTAWTGDNLHSGTYFYVFKVMIDGVEHTKKGFITMIKNN